MASEKTEDGKRASDVFWALMRLEKLVRALDMPPVAYLDKTGLIAARQELKNERRLLTARIRDIQRRIDFLDDKNRT